MHINLSTRSLMLRSLSLALVMLAMSAGALGQFRVAITIAPPALPVYETTRLPRRRLYLDARLLVLG